MSGKRKQGKRYPCGKLRPISQNTLAAMEQETEKAIKAVVLAQPHRRGNLDQMAESALGRLVMARKLRSEVYHAGNEYADIVRRWRAAKGVPVDLRLNVGGGGDGPSEETVADWGRKMERVEAAVRLVSAERGLRLMNSVVLDCRDVSYLDEMVTCAALIEVTYTLGRLAKAAHPFVSGDGGQARKAAEHERAVA